MKEEPGLLVEAVPGPSMDDLEGDLSPEQIDQLLKEAERRLRAKNAPEQVAMTRPDEGILELATEADQSAPPHFSFPSLNPGNLQQPYIHSTGDLAHVDEARLVDQTDRKLAETFRTVEDPVVMKQKLQREKVATAGSDWFNLPRTKLTPELKRDLQLLRMRSVLDPKRHYKKESSKQLVPDFCQVGTIVAGPTEFFSSRVPNKERKKTFVDEVLSKGEDLTRFKNKYDEVQKSKTSGKKAYYKSLKAKRSSGVMRNR